MDTHGLSDTCKSSSSPHERRKRYKYKHLAYFIEPRITSQRMAFLFLVYFERQTFLPPSEARDLFAAGI